MIDSISYSNIVDNIPKLQWACRRGMKELDDLLSNYLKNCYAISGLEDKHAFIQLLSYSDPEIFSWLFMGIQPMDPCIAKIIEAIKHHGHTRN